MLELYFGNVPSILSTIVFFVFVWYFIKTIRKPEENRKWKKASIITVLTGTLMSALSGIKDTVAEKTAVSFEQMNIPLAILCGLGLIAVISGVTAGFCKKEKVNKVIFFILNIIIFAKTAVVEILRIKNLF
jgi:hypothetical protein